MNRIKTLFQDIANTIRELTGKTEKISPVNFNEEIKKIITARDLLNKSITQYNFRDMTTIPDYAFYQCTKLAKVDCPNVTTIGTGAFYYCSSLTNIELSDNITEIKPGAFQGSGLQSVKIPKELIKIDGYVFNYCSNLESITFNDKIQSIGHMTFRGCHVLEQDIILPESCKTIGQEAFRASPIKSLSGYLTTISGGAFRECTELNTLVLKGDTVCTLSATTTFIGTQIASGEGYIYVPDNLVEDYKAATNWSTYETQIKPISEFNQEVNNNDTTN